MTTTKTVITNVQSMMVLDNLPTAQQTSMNGLITQVLANTVFLNSLKGNIDSIIADGKSLSINDVPKIILLQLQIQNNLPGLLNLSTSLQLWQVKYLCYASLLYCIYTWHPTFFTQLTPDLFAVAFSDMWNLVSINPATIGNAVNAVETKVKSCC